MATAPVDLRIVARARGIPEWATDLSKPVPHDHLEDCYRGLLHAAERGEAERDGLLETPGRAARAWRDLTCGYSMDPADFMKTFDNDGGYDEMVLTERIPFYSLCEHHLLPFHGHIAIGYLPGERILGLSKFARLAECYARRLQNQERLTAQIADAMETHLHPAGTIVVVRAEHLCMGMRGVRTPGATTITSAVRGALKDKPEARAEALTLLR